MDLLLSQIFPPQPGGSGRWFYEISRRRTDTSIVVTNTCEDQLASLPNVRHINLCFRNTGGFSYHGARDYWKILGDLRLATSDCTFKIATAGRVVPEGWLLWIWKSFFGGPPYQIFAHGEEINLIGVESGGVMSSRQHRRMAKIVFNSAVRVIANSENTKSMLLDQWGIPESRVEVIYPGVDTKYFSPRDNQEAQECLPSSWEKRFVILTVGRLQERKGQDRVIESLVDLKKAIPNLLYVVAGSGEDEQRLRELTENLGLTNYVEFRTSIDDSQLLEFYRNCNVFIMANRQVGSDVEGFGMVFLEAAACGKPTIAGNSGGTREAIENNFTGLLVDGNNTAEIQAAIRKLHDSPTILERMGTAGRNRAVTNFDWDILVEKFNELCN